MSFVQIMEYTTERRAEMDDATAEWLADTEEVRTVRRRLLLRDRDNPARYLEVLFFDSFEDAMHNSGLPASALVSQRAAELTEHGLTFHNLDVVAEGF